MTDDEMIAKIAKLYDEQEELENKAELLSCESCDLLNKHTKDYDYEQRREFIGRIYDYRLKSNTK